MVFRNLPIEFDDEGRPVLREARTSAYVTEGKDVEVPGAAEPAAPAESREELLARRRFVKVFTVPSVADSTALISEPPTE